MWITAYSCDSRLKQNFSISLLRVQTGTHTALAIHSLPYPGVREGGGETPGTHCLRMC